MLLPDQRWLQYCMHGTILDAYFAQAYCSIATDKAISTVYRLVTVLYAHVFYHWKITVVCYGRQGFNSWQIIIGCEKCAMPHFSS
jgi:hypothetical protein